MMHSEKNVTQVCMHIVPLELEGAKLPLYKVAAQHFLTPRGRHVVWTITPPYNLKHVQATGSKEQYSGLLNTK